MKLTRRARLGALLKRNGWRAIGEDEFRQLVAELQMPADQLRRLLRDAGLPLAPLVEGVRQSSLLELERTLRALVGEYAPAGAARRQQIRRLVIVARDHARLAARRNPAPGLKTEAILWMSTWLENPEAFPIWVVLRKQAC